MSVRVRFAPSPTGMLHVGALRTVLFNYLFVRKHGGQLILRVEDTDRDRYDPASEREMIDTLRWVGIEFDEGPHVGGAHSPYRQSERKEMGFYMPWAERLIAHGHAYKAFESPEELAAMRRAQEERKESTGYFGGVWRDASPEQVAAAEVDGKPYVIRQKIPRDRTIVTEDAIRGVVEVESNLLPDPVLIKTDGMPTYHLAAIVDDHLMGITHVFRGDEWLPSYPQHRLLYEQFDWEPPVYVHCPVIVGKDGKKLSKRHGATRVLDYGAMGFLKGALLNFVALIGWSPGHDREQMTMEEMIDAFSIEGLHSSPGRFDLDKLHWLNGLMIRQMSADELLDAAVEYASNSYTERYWTTLIEPEEAEEGAKLYSRLARIPTSVRRDREYVRQAIVEAQPRVKTLAELGEALEFFLVEEPPMDEKAVAKWFAEPHVGDLFDHVSRAVAEQADWTPAEYEELLKGFQAVREIPKLGPIVHPIRVALSGKTTGPGLFELMTILGPARIQRRLARAKGML